jgi:hypothetical protein
MVDGETSEEAEGQEQKLKADADRTTLIAFLLNEIKSQDDGSRQIVTFAFTLSVGYIYFSISNREEIIAENYYIIFLFVIVPILMFYLSAAIAIKNLRPTIDKSTLDDGISPEYLIYLIEDKNKEYRYSYLLMAIGFGIILIGLSCYLLIL